MKNHNKVIMDHLFDILYDIKLNYIIANNLIVSNCPLHGGDNCAAFNINIDESSEYYGRWFCNTKKCHEIYGGDMLAFLRLLIEKKNGPIHYRELLKIVSNMSRKRPKRKTKSNNIAKRNSVKSYSRWDVRQKLDIPAKYYLDRGFESHALDELDIGTCVNKQSKYYKCVAFPVYDFNDRYTVGFVYRRTDPVPHEKRWINYAGFAQSRHLYNIGKAKDYIRQTGVAVLVEGQGDVAKLWGRGVRNVCGMFGSDFNAWRTFVLKSLGVHTVIPLTDNDEAGEKCKDKIIQTTDFTVQSVEFDAKDVAELCDIQLDYLVDELERMSGHNRNFGEETSW